MSRDEAGVVEGLTEREQRRLAAAKDDIADLLEGPLGVPLNERGERALRAGTLPVLDPPIDDPAGIVSAPGNSLFVVYRAPGRVSMVTQLDP